MFETDRVQKAICFLSSMLISLAFLQAPGTSDMQIWEQWIKTVNSYGLVDGFVAINDVQPPLCSVFLYTVNSFAQAAGFPVWYAIKVSVTLSLFISTIMVLVWSRSFVIASLFQIMLAINVGFGYLDIYYTPFLLASLYALEKGKFSLSFLIYTIGALIKSQPLLLAPFFIAYIYYMGPVNSISGKIKHVIRAILPTFVLIVIPLIFIYNKALIQFILNAQQGHSISSKAFNVGWILTYMINSQHIYGNYLIGWGINNQLPQIPEFSIPLKLMFFAAYGFTLYKFCAEKEKKFDSWLKYLALAFFSYFILNSGVHENHLFILMMLSVPLYHKKLISIQELAIIGIYGNLNHVLYYGIDGKGLPFERGFFPWIDISIIFTIVFLAFYLIFFIKVNGIKCIRINN